MKNSRYRRIRSLSLLILVLALAAELDRRMEAIAAQGIASTEIAVTDSEPAPEVVAPTPEPAPAEDPVASERDKTLNAMRRAIIGQESGGNFLAVNRDSGALGYGQVMPQNLYCSWDGVPNSSCGWDWDALARDYSRDEFLNDPDAQIAIINDRLGRYLDQELAKGNDHDIAIRRVASLWYSGQAGIFDDTSPQYYKGNEYPSMRAYTTSVLEKYKVEKGQ